MVAKFNWLAQSTRADLSLTSLWMVKRNNEAKISDLKNINFVLNKGEGEIFAYSRYCCIQNSIRNHRQNTGLTSDKYPLAAGAKIAFGNSNLLSPNIRAPMTFKSS